MIEQEKREVGGWWLWVLGLMALTIIVLTTLGYFGKLTGTIVERKVFENSYQRSEGLKSQMLTWEAQLASINSQLVYAEGEDFRAQLMSQKAMLEMQIAQTRGMK